MMQILMCYVLLLDVNLYLDVMQNNYALDYQCLNETIYTSSVACSDYFIVSSLLSSFPTSQTLDLMILKVLDKKHLIYSLENKFYEGK